MSLNPPAIRDHFPALKRPAVFLDNPGGTQVADYCLNRMEDYLIHHNSNHGGAFATSAESDAILQDAHQAMADFIHAARAEEIVFGANMTTLTLYISRSLARTWQPGDEIVVTRLDHDANVTPWVLAAEDRGCKVRRVDFHPENGTLDLESLQTALEGRPKLLAVGYASNALGTINPVAKIVEMAHSAGALVYVDAVQYAPHGPIDVQALGCDFLVASAYKFFGPHVGALYGRHDLLEELFAYKVRPAPNEPPGKFETGTQNHEGIAGVLGALEYLEWVGRSFGSNPAEPVSGPYQGRTLLFKQAMAAIRNYEFELSRAVLETLEETPGVHIFGLTDSDRLDERVPTFSFILEGQNPRAVAQALGKEEIFVWDGNYYALSVTERLGVEKNGGMVRVGPVHYNTVEEIEQFGKKLGQIATRV